MLRDAWFIARKDVQYLLRRRETLMWTFLMPIVFFYFIGTITGGFGGPAGVTRDRLAVRVPADGGILADQFLARLDSLGYRVERVTSDSALARSPRRLTIPGGFSDSLRAGRPIALVLELDEDGPSRSYDEVRGRRALYGTIADLVTIEQAGGEVTRAALDSLRTLPRSIRLAVSAAGARAEPPVGFAQAVPGTMTMFNLLVMLTGGAALLVAERRQGLLRRLAATPISRGSVVLGKWGGRMAFGLIQIGFAVVVGTLFFRMDWGGSLPMVSVVLVAYAGMNAAIGLVLANVAGTESQMIGIGVLTSNLLAALGGCWWPIEVTPGWMQRIALALPTGWAMDALHRLVSFGQAPIAALPHVLVMAAAALVMGGVARRIFRYQ